MMKKLSLALLLVFAGIGNAQTYTYPSAYLTIGDYSNNTQSISFAFYNTLQFSKEFYLVNNLENLIIDNPKWKYDQKHIVSQVIYDDLPITLKLAYGFYYGKYSTTPSRNNYEDNINLYSADFIGKLGSFYLGASYTRTNLDGYLHQTVNQITPRFEMLFGANLFVSVKPSYAILEDKRKLFSVSAKAHYYAGSGVLLKAGGFYGKRAYYFDSDLITYFNQNETQKNNFFGQVEYVVDPKLRAILSFQQTQFTSYSIRYYILGVKSFFSL